MPGKGFNQTPSASEYRKYNSFGRTRQAKNLAGKHAAEITPSGAAPTTVDQGFATETQKHLHLFLKEADGVGLTITVWAWTHAFGEWYKLQSGAANVTIAASNSTKVMSGADAVDISGVDRVYFQITAGAHEAADKFFAAANTIVAT